MAGVIGRMATFKQNPVKGKPLATPRTKPWTPPSSFNAYAAGSKNYGAGGDAATVGPVDPSGYISRDARVKAQRNALQAHIQSQLGGQTASANYLRKAR